MCICYLVMQIYKYSVAARYKLDYVLDELMPK
jgi:hypothetical protein